jgi:hypothetical protein
VVRTGSTCGPAGEIVILVPFRIARAKHSLHTAGRAQRAGSIASETHLFLRELVPDEPDTATAVAHSGQVGKREWETDGRIWILGDGTRHQDPCFGEEPLQDS